MFDDYAGGLSKGSRPGTWTTRNLVASLRPAPRCRRSARGQSAVTHEMSWTISARRPRTLQHLQAELKQLSQTLGTKQDPLTRLSRDNARLAAELSQAQAQIHQVETEARSLRDQWVVAREAGRQAEAPSQRVPPGQECARSAQGTERASASPGS